MIDGLGLEVGAGYRLPFTTASIADGGEGAAGLPAGTRNFSPIEVGLGADYRFDAFRIRMRAGILVPGGAYLLDAKANQAEYARLRADRKNPSLSQFFLTTDESFVLNDNGNIDEIPRGWQTSQKDDLRWGIGILPSYRFGRFTLFLNIGAGMTHYASQTINYIEEATFDANGNMLTPAKNVSREVQGRIVSDDVVISNPYSFFGKDTAMERNLRTVNYHWDWFFNPYIRFPVGGSNFMAGLIVWNDGTRIPARWDYSKAVHEFANDPDFASYGVEGGGPVNVEGFGAVMSVRHQLKWRIPIGFNWYF